MIILILVVQNGRDIIMRKIENQEKTLKEKELGVHNVGAAVGLARTSQSFSLVSAALCGRQIWHWKSPRSRYSLGTQMQTRVIPDRDDRYPHFLEI